ncbi:hypothetical protein K449DRAFT_383962 [Hypoxylon sp. EC38]|nr:hypothetical protein K449DRAFT_383962 [Hypoxylon sp. EC38]
MIQYDIYVGFLRGNVGKPESNPADRLRESRESHGLSCRLRLHKKKWKDGNIWLLVFYSMFLRNLFKWVPIGPLGENNKLLDFNT